MAHGMLFGIMVCGSLLLAQEVPEKPALPVNKDSSSLVQPFIKGKPPTAEIKAFLDAREQHVRAGRTQPHLDMLKAMVASKDVTKRLWALARLVEAGDMDSYVSYGEAMVQHVRGTVQAGSGLGEAKARPAWEVIGAGAPDATHLSAKSPFWLSLAKTLQEEPDAPVDSLLYSVWCYNTAPEHRELIELVARRIKSKLTLQSREIDPWSDPRFWIVTDWAIVWGDEEDFARLEQLIQDQTARREFKRRFDELRKIQAFLPCLSANRAQREKTSNSQEPSAVPKEMAERLKTFQGAAPITFSNVKIMTQPRTPAYPREAQGRRLMADMAVEITIDPSGVPCMVRAKPGPFLVFFAPVCLEFSEGWRFKPAMLNGIPQYARFLLNMPFRLR